MEGIQKDYELKEMTPYRGAAGAADPAGQPAAGLLTCCRCCSICPTLRWSGGLQSSTALGAVGSTSIFVTLFTGFLIGLSNGINVLVARFYGAPQRRACIIRSIRPDRQPGSGFYPAGHRAGRLPCPAAAFEHQGGSAPWGDLVSAGVFSGHACPGFV